ncbi:MAG TPA: RNase adapter RapZ [Pseudogracilibacillus sp.]|nr:RNase adapter RapZ [Pseudogracilibacillus sp.]
MMPGEETKLVIITGMSGAGKTVAVQSFEDLGYYCVDNLPPTLIPKFLELMKDSTNNVKKVALVIDLRGREFFEELYKSLDAILNEDWLEEQILFLDAEDQVLVSRYKETRRSHPLNISGLPLEGIQEERVIIDELRGRAQRIIDTSNLKPKALREKIHQLYSEEKETLFSVHFVSFGFKHGVPIDADVMFDVRFLPNPFYVEHMRPLTGLDKEVADYVFKWKETEMFNQKFLELLQFTIPLYKKEGKSQIVIAIGCTGGQHRSVALSEYFAKEFSSSVKTHVTHRDIEKRKVD